MARPAIHPGEILADELNELRITPTELSRRISVPPNRVSQIIQGKRTITGDTMFFNERERIAALAAVDATASCLRLSRSCRCRGADQLRGRSRCMLSQRSRLCRQNSERVAARVPAILLATADEVIE
jgi:hypothetical protein